VLALPPAPLPLPQQARAMPQEPRRRRRAATRGLATSRSRSRSRSRAAGGEGRACTGRGGSAPSHAAHSSARALSLAAGHSGGSHSEAARAVRGARPRGAGGGVTGAGRHAPSGWRQGAGSCDGSTARPKRQRRARARVCPRRGGGVAAARYETGTGTPPTQRPRSTASRAGRQRARASGAPASAEEARLDAAPLHLRADAALRTQPCAANPAHPTLRGPPCAASPIRTYRSRTCPRAAHVPSPTLTLTLTLATYRRRAA